VDRRLSKGLIDHGHDLTCLKPPQIERTGTAGSNAEATVLTSEGIDFRFAEEGPCLMKEGTE